MSPGKDRWSSGDAYEPYVGRWSRLVAREFLDWLARPSGLRWLDVGCGTGALTEAILERTAPSAVTAVDASEGYLAHAQARIGDARVAFQGADAASLPVGDAAQDVVVSGLVLNFLPDPRRGVDEMRRVARPGATVAAYVWDYAGDMQLMRYFWDAAVALAPDALALDEGRRFPIARPEPLTSLFHDADLRDVEVRAIDVPTVFQDFDDYWSPFLGGQAPAPGYCMSLEEEPRRVLKERLRATLPRSGNGTIRLNARAWAVRGRRA